MKFISNINLPQKSIFGFKILSSLQSSLSCYLLLIIGRLLNPLFGFDQIQIITASLFNILLNISIVILIINLFIKKKELPKINFIFLNSLLFIYFPIALYFIFKYMKYLFFVGSNQKNLFKLFTSLLSSNIFKIKLLKIDS